MNKHDLRKDIRNRKRQHSSEELERMSQAVVAKLLQHPKLAKAQTLLLYYSLPDEVNTHEMVETLYKQGKRVLLPKVIGDGVMELRVYEGEESMVEGAFHIMEPGGPLFTDYAAIDLAFIPGMAFDGHGNRLGRGKGFYDRLLVQTPTLYKIGVCFDFQKVDHVPTEPTDVAIDEVV